MSAPLAEAVVAVAGRRVHNFHALPLTAIRHTLPEPWRSAYGRLLGGAADVSLSGTALDSPFRPSGPLREAQIAAARFFGADDSLFVTGGTTLANRIALEAVVAQTEHPTTVVLDPNCHQSAFFSAQALGAVTLPAPSLGSARGLPVRRLDVPATAALLRERRRAGRPVASIVLTAAPYDGSRLALDVVLPALVAASPETVFVIDEAWAAVHALHPSTSGPSALPVLAGLRERGVNAIVTQSAHKTLLALRQASFAHVVGSPELVTAARRAYFRTHTSSPSWPILASLDLARAHAEVCGRQAVARALDHRARLVAALHADGRTRGLVAGEDAGLDRNPMMVELRLPPGGDAADARRRLYEDHRIVLARAANGCLLAHVHIGVREDDVEALAVGLRTVLGRRSRPHPDRPTPPVLVPAVGTVLDGFLVTYPPGVPIAVPGETWTATHAEVLARHRDGGAEVFLVPGRGEP